MQGWIEHQDAILCLLVPIQHIHNTPGKHLKKLSLFLILRDREDKLQISAKNYECLPHGKRAPVTHRF